MSEMDAENTLRAVIAWARHSEFSIMTNIRKHSASKASMSLVNAGFGLSHWCPDLAQS